MPLAALKVWFASPVHIGVSVESGFRSNSVSRGMGCVKSMPGGMGLAGVPVGTAA
jgi:hypothetical protein